MAQKQFCNKAIYLYNFVLSKPKILFCVANSFLSAVELGTLMI